MEDENDIDLSLSLPCGQSSSKSKGKDSSLDIKTVEASKSTKLMDDLRNFLHTGIQKEDSVSGSQGSDSAKPQDNFFSNLKISASDADACMNLHGNHGSQFAKYGGHWVANSSKSAEVEEEKSDHRDICGIVWSESGDKRKIIFDELNHQKKKHEREVHHADAHKTNPPMGIIRTGKASHVSVTTEDGSTAENEEVAESEAEGSTSRLLSHHEDSTKQYIGGGGSCEVAKEGHGFTRSSVIDVQGPKQSDIPPGNEMKLGNLTYGVPLTAMSMSYSLPAKVPNSNGTPSTSGYPMQLMPSANGERPGMQPANPGNLPLLFGYSSIQLPSLQTDHSWGAVSHHQQQFPPSSSGRTVGGAALISDNLEDGVKTSQAVFHAPHNFEALPYEGRTSELAKVGGKQRSTDEGGGSSSSQTGDEVKGNSTIRQKEASDQVPRDPHESSVIIRPGISADLKFGGCGSHPNLPWVSTTGPGPNGKTISGVTYRYNRNQIRIVCACHGSHMSPEEFAQHACADHPNPESSTGVASFPSSNPAASAQS